ncbi:MAG: hypothetical protein V3S30_06480 [Thermoanaerobaculia bacterium]
MKRLNCYIALCVGALLFAAPVAFACGELVGMASQCSTAETAEMAESVDPAMCHDSGQMTEGCCDVRSAPDSLQASSFESDRLLTALDATDLRAVVPPATSPLHFASVDAFGKPDLERYTLFSSFLL